MNKLEKMQVIKTDSAVSNNQLIMQYELFF